MARTVRDARLDSRSARAKLAPQAKPYWRTINEGAHLGYYRGARVGKWVARFRAPGSAGYMQETLGEADDTADADDERILDYRQAQNAARVWFEARARGDVKAGPYTVGNALDDYLEGHTGKSKYHTAKRVESIVRPALGAIELGELTQKQVADWHRERGASPARLRTSRLAKVANERPADTSDAIRRRRSTANRDLTVLKAALNKAWADGKVASDAAWRRVKPFANVDAAKLRYLNDSEAQRLVNAMAPAFRPVASAALLTGGRYGELTAIKVHDVDLSAATVRLVETKSGKPRAVFLSDEGVALFRSAIAGKLAGDLALPRPDGQQWGASQQARYMDAACEAGKVDRATFHDLRRTFGARLAINGVPMAVIAEALGHADERITRKHYAHLAPSYVAEKVRAGIAGLGIIPPTNVTPLRA